MHAAPLTIQIVVVPSGVAVLLGTHNTPCSWTSTIELSLFYSIDTIELLLACGFDALRSLVSVC
jgi:hypothetical protein